jgi:hypothetical protein
MGSNLSRELADGIDAVEITLHQQIAIQLQSNHYPPITLSMVEPCIKAIEAFNEDDSERQIDLPAGITWRGQYTAPASAIVKGHHLEPWVNNSDEDDDEF